MKLKFPTKYDLDYPEKNKNYYGNTYRKEIEDILLKASDKYCMYCGKSLCIDNDMAFNIEHSIEKSGYKGIKDDINFLKHCKFNMSVACYSCNQKYKNRMVERIDSEFVKSNIDCSKKECKKPCDDLLKIREEYYLHNSIILQPFGRKDENEQYYQIEYNLLKHIFEPVIKENDDLKKINFIKDHIARFHLNKNMFSDSILEICEVIIGLFYTFGEDIIIDQVLKILEIRRENNILGVVFLDFIRGTFKKASDLNKFCKLLILLDYI